MAPGDLEHRGHVARVTVEMHNHDCARPLGDLTLDVLGKHVHRVRIDVRENRNRSLLEYGRDAAEVGDRRGDDLVARLGVDRPDSEMNGGRAGGRRHRILDPVPLGKALFQLGHEMTRPAEQVLPTKRFKDERALLGPERLPARERLSADRPAPVQRELFHIRHPCIRWGPTDFDQHRSPSRRQDTRRRSAHQSPRRAGARKSPGSPGAHPDRSYQWNVAA